MRKHLLASLAAIGALIVAVPISAAAPAPVSPTPAASSPVAGAPTIDNDHPTGYYIWRDDGFHLRTHGPGAQHDFDAVLRTNGIFENVDPVRLEKDDVVEVRNGGHELVIHFHTFDFTDGVNFTIRDGTKLRLKLKLDDKPIGTDSIFLGAKGRHPKHNPFTIHLRDRDRKKGA